MKRLAPHIWRARSSDISLTPKLLADAVDSSTTLHVVPETTQAGCDFVGRNRRSIFGLTSGPAAT